MATPKKRDVTVGAAKRLGKATVSPVAPRAAVETIDAAIKENATGLVDAPKPAPVATVAPEPVKFEQITFKCSPTMADTLFNEGGKVGGIRVILAQALKAMGLAVADEDLSPRELRRTNRRQRTGS